MRRPLAARTEVLHAASAGSLAVVESCMAAAQLCLIGAVKPQARGAGFGRAASAAPAAACRCILWPRMAGRGLSLSCLNSPA